MSALPAEVFERRFGGLRRLYGVDGAQRIFDAHVVVVGIGGVGSWAVEALARSGVRRLSLVDLDHVSESNINRQIHALEPTLGQAKAEAMRERIALFHPGCTVDVIDEFVTPDNWPGLLDAVPGLKGVPSALIDACDQVRAKTTLAHWSVSQGVPFVTVGAAGGKRQAQAVEVADLADTTHDPLLAQLRYRLRKHHAGARSGRMDVACVFSREAVAPPDASCGLEDSDGSLNCHGYGSAVSVTATFGLCAAGWVMNTLAAGAKKSHGPQSVVTTTL
ncbi:tRNA threonylcarbamoyladenosine dehydratase [Hydrogenophaga laconesensis]|uniref:tRNA A37 threonylcarbamoyladenosine dehydratase n=1 Tax=Hydrogenophaga laconesensis TaxID=1805971 RepID=A0ABU1V4B4_9BURK|nr:tRNA threonylcarbamoyladenosine dehydratase [Hydrogenophaga laconesensis]MDR7092292.1 tRNA A37 threonylcarbamoyladenosine dehydratase [Hydrogenophaga laconesensis]